MIQELTLSPRNVFFLKWFLVKRSGTFYFYRLNNQSTESYFYSFYAGLAKRKKNNLAPLPIPMDVLDSFSIETCIESIVTGFTYIRRHRCLKSLPTKRLHCRKKTSWLQKCVPRYSNASNKRRALVLFLINSCWCSGVGMWL